jgi:tRNA-specific 2-thiouridylase
MTQHRGVVVVAMSGGVDSSVAAATLKDEGWEVIGVTMQIWPGDAPQPPDSPRGCCSLGAVEDARRVADRLAIPFYVFDLRDVFQEQVIDPFCADYASGRTPNPCILCNRYVKFGALAEQAQRLGADHIATGHYARVEQDGASGRWMLRAGVDRSKDQSYVLYSLRQEQLALALLPLGHLTKDEVRGRARDLGLAVADKLESQEICFIVDNDYPAYLRRVRPGTAAPGPIVDSSGKRLGAHRGIAFYTIGQRKGLGAKGTAQALYVVDIDPHANAIVVGPETELYRAHVTAAAANYVARAGLEGPARLQGKLRYKMAPSPCTVTGCDDVLEAEFEQPQRAVTPGQAAVFYDGETVACGGVIERRSDGGDGRRWDLGRGPRAVEDRGRCGGSVLHGAAGACCEPKNRWMEPGCRSDWEIVPHAAGAVQAGFARCQSDSGVKTSGWCGARRVA